MSKKLDEQIDLLLARMEQTDPYGSRKKAIKELVAEAQLETAEYFKKYMVTTSPFIEEIAEPYIDNLKAQL